MLYDEKDLSELHFMKHRHDDNKDWNDYEKNILDRMLSPNIYNSTMMVNFLTRLQPLAAKLFDHFNILKNWNNYMVDKYYHKHRK